MAYDRAHPFPARLVDKRWLTGPGSDRPTLHVAFSITGTGWEVEPGDTVALFAHNERAVVDAVRARLGLGEDVIGALTERLSLGTPSLKLLRAIAEQVEDDDEAAAIEDLCDDDEALDAYLAERDLLDVLGEHPTATFTLAELEPLLPVLQPRTYSVASSRRKHPDEVHLTVGIIRWERAGRVRTGVASAHLERMQVGETMALYHTASKHFRLPAGDAPVVCIGPGTGVAPFRGFLQERGGAGQVWIFFGARTEAHDFYYRDELQAAPRLSTAFSRDQPERVYVQQRMREAGDELVAWLERGAVLYLCGDKDAMAPAVEAALVELLGARGHDGPAYVKRLREEHRFRRDVY